MNDDRGVVPGPHAMNAYLDALRWSIDFVDDHMSEFDAPNTQDNFEIVDSFKPLECWGR